MSYRLKTRLAEWKAKARKNTETRAAMLARYPDAHPDYLSQWPESWREVAALELSRRRKQGNAARGEPFGKYGLVWIESPSRFFRVAGLAHEIRRMDHTGHYSRADEYDSIYRGVVFQLVARDGVPRYLAGYEEGESTRKGWQYSSGEEGAAVDLAEYHDCPKEAANSADEYARIYAEHSRDYDSAWQAGSQWAARCEEAASLRAEAVAAMREAAESVCAALHLDDSAVYRMAGQVLAAARLKYESTRGERRGLFREMAKLSEGEGIGRECFASFYSGDSEMRLAFNEGAGRSILSTHTKGV